MAILEAKNISYAYKTKYQTTPALSAVCCRFESGKLYAVVGRSGSGKTTLLSILAGLAQPEAGEVCFDGTPIRSIGLDRYRREDVAVIYQNFNLFSMLNVWENVVFPLRLQHVPKRESKTRAFELLKSVGITEEQAQKLPSMLSGGEQQRVAIARALASRAKILLADEPTGNLDSENGENILQILKNLAAEGYCVVIVTHDLHIAEEADEVIRMRDGRVEGNAAGEG